MVTIKPSDIEDNLQKRSRPTRNAGPSKVFAEAFDAAKEK